MLPFDSLPPSAPLSERIRLAAQMFAAAERPVLFTGAGLSTDSGLPDYRGPDGVWTRRDQGLPPPAARVSLRQATPNASHLAIVRLHQQGKLDLLISQNVDGLHLRSGIPLEKLAELHGNAFLLKCLDCDRRFAHQEVGWDERRHGKGYRTSAPLPGQPLCPDCGGRIISSVINFGDAMPPKEMELAEAHSQHCDLFLVIGSSLAVSPANSFPEIAKKQGAPLLILNRGETPLDPLADLRFTEGIGEVLPPLVDELEHLLQEPG